MNTEDSTPSLDDTDAERLELLDRWAKRVPEINFDKHEVEWTTLPDGGEALVVDGGSLDGGNGMTFSIPRDDVLALASTRQIQSAR